MDSKIAQQSLINVQRHVNEQLLRPLNETCTLPTQEAIQKATASIIKSLSEHEGLGVGKLTDHLLHDIAQGLNGSSLSANYYGFVTGGITPAARIADQLVTLYDQNAAVHLPEQSIATVVEHHAIQLFLQLLQFDPSDYVGTFTTGATACNTLGLACGREYVLSKACARDEECDGEGPVSVGELGLLEACRRADVNNLAVVTTMPHSSLGKAASAVGIGRASVIDASDDGDPNKFDLQKLEVALKLSKTACIVVISCGEVNTGSYATHGLREVEAIRSLCDAYGAWLHVDGAFGIFARALNDEPEFACIREGTEGLELADSICVDGHKILNVPYDCGIFLCRHSDMAQRVFQNANAAYLQADKVGDDTIQSPLNIGLENSRRFRALPVYATLVAYGRKGYQDMLSRQVRFARAVARYIRESESFELLPELYRAMEDPYKEIFIIVLFRAKTESLNKDLVKKVNQSSKIYLSGTSWAGKPAARAAVSNWQVDPERDMEIFREVMEKVERS